MIGIEFNQALIRRWIRQATPDPDLHKPQLRLLRSGVAPQHVDQAVSEPRDRLEGIGIQAAKRRLPK